MKDFPKEYVLDRWSRTPDSTSFDATLNAAESSSCSDIRTIRQIVEDTVDILMPFKDRLDMYRLRLLDLLSLGFDVFRFLYAFFLQYTDALIIITLMHCL